MIYLVVVWCLVVTEVGGVVAVGVVRKGAMGGKVGMEETLAVAVVVVVEVDRGLDLARKVAPVVVVAPMVVVVVVVGCKC